MVAQPSKNQDHSRGKSDAGQRLHPLHQVGTNSQGRLTLLSDLKKIFPFEDDSAASRDGIVRLKKFLEGFDHPQKVLKGLKKLLKLGDPLVAPPETFLHRRHTRQFETWDYPVTLQTLIEPEEGRLLSLPPGTRRYQGYCRLIGEIVDMHMRARFPRLLAELANRPNLFFPGVYFPQELSVANMEMISAMHGTFYVVHAELSAGADAASASVVLKPTDMALESIVTFILQFINRRLDPAVRRKIGPISAPTIVAIDDTYGILDLIPGKNGVEFLPNGIKTGTILDLRSNEYPEDLALSREEVLQIAREFAKQAVTAYYLRLYDRKPDQLMIQRTADRSLSFAHIDFGRALKRNYALPWKRHYDPSRPALTFDIHEIPYFEAAAAFIYLPHFIPARWKGDLNPFEGIMRDTIVETFVILTREIKSNLPEILSLFKYLIGRKTQYRPAEVGDTCVEPQDVEEVHKTLLALDNPKEIIESILNLAYHERQGSTALRIEGEDGDQPDTGVYRRALLSGDRITSLRDIPGGPYPYRLVDYRKLGRVSYDAELKTLQIEFGGNPERVIGHIELNFSRRLAGYIRQFPGDPKGVELEIASDGSVVVRKVSDEGGVALKRRLNFPQEIMREINEAGSGFAPEPHVLARVAEFKKDQTDDDYLQEDIAKQRSIIANDLEGKEILQFVMAVETEGSPLWDAMTEMIQYLLANPDFLADKDPYESINQLVVSLGRKHLLRQWPDGMAMAREFLPRDLLEDKNLDARKFLKIYEKVDMSHFVHLILTVRFAQELGQRARLSDADLRLLLSSAFLHDLNVLDLHFREVLMEPSGRLNRPILTAVLDQHAQITGRILERLLAEGKLVLPSGAAEGAESIQSILQHHHRSAKDSSAQTARAGQILHLADNIAVFADRTRPDHWNRGFLRLEDIAPRWIDAQLERNLIERNIWEAASGFFSDPANRPLLRRLDRMSAFYPQCYSALQMAAQLHLGLNPQHPNPMADLKERYGSELVNKIFDNLMKSGLSVRDKIKVINRTDSIAPMLQKENVASFAFINAGAQPVQRVVELILRFVREGRIVILMGILPRVIKTYERFLACVGDAGTWGRGAGLRPDPAGDGAADAEKLVVIAGERRLQFVTHSYPYEADFKMPFHRIIRLYRESKHIQDPCCLIPFERFMETYAPTAEPEERVRKLEKASDVEEIRANERVKAEADRYMKWESSGKPASFDARGKERFRRILLGGFTNRDVLLFYDETVQGDPPFKKALREAIGALHENPNYLSDRSVYYSIQELVRSLGQIHFHPESGAAAASRKFLQKQGLPFCVKLTALLDAHKPQFNFFKEHLSSCLQIAVHLGRRWEQQEGSPLAESDWRVITACTLLTGSLLDDGAVADVMISPEDVSANRALRHLLSGESVSLLSLVERRKDAAALIKDDDRKRILRMLDRSPIENAQQDLIPFLIVQTALTFGSFCDFSKVENWKRGKIEISTEELDCLWEFLSEEFWLLPGAAKNSDSPEARGFDRLLRNFCRQDGPGLLNHLSEKTHSYVRLFNALSLAAELRYGLKARGFDLFHNVRTIYGLDIAGLLVEGIMDADFPVREKVKFARKLRILAAAVTAESSRPAKIRFISTDHPLGVLSARDSGGVVLLPSGDYDRTVRMFGRLAGRLDRENFLRLRRQVKFLVGEDYPLLIKEKSLQKTDEFRRRIKAYRRRRRLSSRHILMPLGELVDLSAKDAWRTTAEASPAGVGDTGTWGAGGTDPAAEKGLFFFRTWMKLFE